MAAPSLLLLVLAHTLLLSLLPVLLLQLRRLCRAQTHVRSALIAASTLCVGLYGVCALVALAGTSKDEGRVASVVAGTHGCGGVLIMDIFLIISVCCEQRDDASPARSFGVRVAFASLLASLGVITTALHVVLLCLSFSRATRFAIAISRAVVHLVFHTVVALFLLRNIVENRHVYDAETGDWGARGPTSTVGAWYQEDDDFHRAPVLVSPQVGLVLLQLLGVALDIITIASPLRVNYTPLAGGGRSTPTLFGTTSRSSTYVVVASITWLRWAGTLCLATDLSAPCTRSAHTITRGSNPPSNTTARLDRHRSPDFAPGSTISSWAHLDPSSISTRRPATELSRPGTISESACVVTKLSELQPAPGKPRDCSSAKHAPRSSFISLGTSSEYDAGVVELQHPYLHTQMLPATYASSALEDDDEEAPGCSEDLVVPPSPSPLPGGRRRGRTLTALSPPVPPQFGSSPGLQPTPRSLPPLVTNPMPARPLPTAQKSSTSSVQPSNSPAIEVADRRTRRESGSLSDALPRLARKISRTISPSSSIDVDPNYRFPPHRPSLSLNSTLSNSPEHTRSSAHTSTDGPLSTYLSPLSSPRPVRLSSTSSSPIKLRRPSLPRLLGVPDGLSSGSSSPAPNSTLSLSATSRRRSGSVGSLLRSVAARASSRSCVTPTPTPTREYGGTDWWDVEPNENEDDPFARSAPPSVASISLRERAPPIDLTEEGGVLRLRRALEAIEEPPTGSREGSARTSAMDVSFPDVDDDDDDDDDELERVLTPMRSRPSYEAPHVEHLRRRRMPGAGSAFRDHVHSPLSPGSTASLSALTAATAHPLSSPTSALSAVELETPCLPSDCTPRRKRTDQKASISPSARVGRQLQGVNGDGERITPQFLFGGTTSSSSACSPLLASSAPAVASALLGSPRRATRSERTRPSILPPGGACPPSASTPVPRIQRSASFSFRSLRSSTSSSPSILAAPALALRRMRRRSPSPHSTSRISESSDLSFACRGDMASVGDLHASTGGPAVLVLPSSSSDGDETLDKAARDAKVGPGAGVPRRPWWNRLPGSRPSTPYLRSSADPIVPRGSFSAPSSIRSRPASAGSSLLVAQRVSVDNKHSSASSHERCASAPLLAGLRWSQLQLPPVRDVSPFSSMIFHRRCSGRAEIPGAAASLPAQHLFAAPVASREPFPSIEAVPRASADSDLWDEDVVHEPSGRYELPARSFSGTLAVSACGAGADDAQYATAGSETSEPTTLASSATPFSPPTSSPAPVRPSGGDPRSPSVGHARARRPRFGTR